MWKQTVNKNFAENVRTSAQVLSSHSDFKLK